ncbi:NUDIX domain-containing protein [Patescibacteria group bacterium]|nr:NUDIX domain-containing protein [Patescibacteria group bacterium]
MKLATLIYVHDEKEKKTLMMLRNKRENDIHEGKWNGLGGKLEAGESPDHCCVRELAEESGLQAQHIELKGILTAPNFTPDHDRYVFIYVVTKREGELKDCSEGELHRIDDDKLLDLNVREGDTKFLPLLYQPEFFHATMWYKEGKLEKWELR